MGIFNTPMDYDKLQAGKDKPEGSYGSIQWKGTNVCMDIHCECGFHGHVDCDFFYFYKCKGCGKVWEVGYHVKFYEVTDAQNLKALAEDNRPIESQVDEITQPWLKS